MKELAQLIRKGLAHKEVTEDRRVWGAGLIGGRIEANIIGLALIGKLGVKPACRLFEEALAETLAESEDIGPKVKEILHELGLSDVSQKEKLVALHNFEKAERIAQRLETGQLVL